VFTINGFPYGQFHGTRVKEQVYAPDWTTRERLDYTRLLFDVLAQLLPPGVEGSVSTVPGSFKDFITSSAHVQAMRANLWACVESVARLAQRTGQTLHLGLEPEPLCFLETSEETVTFLEQMRADRPGDDRLDAHLGVNYDTCHLAVEFEEPAEALGRFAEHGLKISKIHLSSALRVRPSPDVRAALRGFADDVYLHQVVERRPHGELVRYRDLDVALAQGADTEPTADAEWRIHFHVPLHSPPAPLFGNTRDHLLGVLDLLGQKPALCSHLEMETYTWEVMPAPMKQRSVVDQLVAEYEWTLRELATRGLTPADD
jgi:hypothetical protein